MCCNMQPFLKVINVLFTLVMITIPIILIVLGTVDMFKAITSNDDKAVKEARGSLIKRVTYGILIFLVPFIVRLILQFTEEVFLANDNSGLESPTSWISCWNSTMKGIVSCSSCEDIYEEKEPGNQNPGNNDTEDTKKCYWWKMAICDKSSILDNLGVAENGFPLYTVYSNVVFENNQAVCKVTNSNYQNSGNYCEAFCYGLGGHVDNNSSSCICKVPAILKDDYAETEPRIAFNGEVTVYQISKASPCSIAPTHFKPVGNISVAKQTS